MKLPEFPCAVKKGNSIVKIYRHQNGGYDEFKVCYYTTEGKRKSETFADYSRAKKRADAINDSMNDGSVNTLALSGDDRLEYVRAKTALEPCRVHLDTAAIQFAEAHKLLKGASLIDAVRHYLATRANLEERTVAEVVAEFVAEKESSGVSKAYVAHLKSTCARVAKAFQCQIADVRSGEISELMQELDLEGRTWNNFRTTVKTLFRFAKAKGYLHRDNMEAENVAKRKDALTPTEIFTPSELSALLAHAVPDHIPALAIGAFAGVRMAEICRLDWKEIKLAKRSIEIKAHKSKTGSRRRIPISDNLALWLAPYAREQGPVWSWSIEQLFDVQDELAKRIRDAAAADKLPASFKQFRWKKNALRHSFISYRVSETQDVNKTALEAGNSPRVIFSNYLELVEPEDATAWFSIKPTAAENLLPLPAVQG